jgi:hypothetical protein
MADFFKINVKYFTIDLKYSQTFVTFGPQILAVVDWWTLFKGNCMPLLGLQNGGRCSEVVISLCLTVHVNLFVILSAFV